jgi:membrane protein implicated in regulation of membrane protease activity
MITIPIEDWVFILCTLVGGGLLLITVLVDDVLGGILDALNIDFDIGGVSLVPVMLGFVSMFGVGGLFASQILDLHGGQAAAVGTIAGFIGVAIVWGLFSIFQRSESAPPFSLDDLVGASGSVAVAIPAGRFGTVYVKAEGQTREFSATASADLPSGLPITVTATTGTGLVVAPLERAASAST